MGIKELNAKKVPIVKIDKSLEKLTNKALFPEKLENDDNQPKIAGLPKTEKER